MSTPLAATRSSEPAVSDRKLFALITLSLFLVLLGTADRSIPYHIDPFTNVITAQAIATSGSPILSEYEQFNDPDRVGVFAWVVDSERGPVSQYPPGTALLAAPFYLFAPETDLVEIVATNDTEQTQLTVPVPSFWPAAFTASLAVAVAAGFVALSVRGVTGSTRWAVGAALVLVAGTGIWLNGAFQLWQHGPSSMWLAAAGWASVRGRWHWAGLAFAAAILTRPPVALIAAAVGLYAAGKQRTLKPMVLVGLGASVGAVAILGYNYWLFETISISGGYSSAFTEQLVETDTLAYVRNVWGGLFSLQRGLFVWSPVVAVGAFGALQSPQPRRNATMGGLIGGVILLLVQYKANRYSGGEGFFSYRYPIEAIVAAAPALALGAKALVENRLGRMLVVTTAVSSVMFHLTALFTELGSG